MRSTKAVITTALLTTLLPGCFTGGRGDRADIYPLAPTLAAVESLVPNDDPPAILDPEQEAEVWIAIEELFDPRFPVYTRAAGVLIEIGEPVLPYLILVGPRERIDIGVGAPAAAPIIYRILADLPSERLVSYLQSPYEELRHQAIRQLGNREELGAIPHLLACLEDNVSPESRERSFDALRSITRLPTERPDTWEEDAEEHVRAWQEWWRIRYPGNAEPSPRTP